MLPGKTYGPEDYLWALWRRKWVGIVPAVVIAAGVFLWARSLPDVYQAEARILIVPQRVPESYVRTTVTSRLDERLQALSQDILSRTRLERLIQDLNLYPEERKTMIMEDIVGKMRQAVNIE